MVLIDMVINKYVGDELETFEKAKNWKKYYTSFVKPYLKGDVLDVGAGIGGTTVILCDGSQKSWVCLEPDAEQSEQIHKKIDNGELPTYCESVTGTIDDISDKVFDTVLYVDVVEHIEDDVAEIKKAVEHLKVGGYLILVLPAKSSLYSPFDKAVGHFRRYDKKSLRNIIPSNITEKKLIYLDLVGVLLSWSNKHFLKQRYPTEKQILFWDKYLIKVSKVLDKISRYSTGKELIGVWQKTSQ